MYEGRASYYRNAYESVRNIKTHEVVWRKIKEFPAYQVNQHGEIRHIKSYRFVCGRNQPSKEVILKKGGRSYHRTAGILREWAFPDWIFPGAYK